MSNPTAEARLNATLDALDALILTTPASQLAPVARQGTEATAVRRLLHQVVRQTGGTEPEPTSPVISNTDQQLRIVRDFVSRHPEHQGHFSMVFGEKKPSADRIEDAWQEILRLQEQLRRKRQK